MSNVKVFIRVRPTDRGTPVLHISNCKKIVVDKPSSKTFSFEKVFDENSSQEDLFKDVMSPVINDVLASYCCSVITYGSFEGVQNHHNMINRDSGHTGLITRSLIKLFEELNVLGVDYNMRVSYFGIFNEELIDLLSSSDEESKLRLTNDEVNRSSVIVHGLTDIIVKDIDTALNFLDKGLAKQFTISQNAHSRGHTIFNVTIHYKKDHLGEDCIHVGKLSFVDLNIRENAVGSLDQIREVGRMNQSILTLSRVIMALDDSSHVPYRESKLTRLLQDSLGGSSKTCFIGNISSSFLDLDDTLSTLNLMNSAKNITNTPQPMKPLSPKSLESYAEEICKLHRELEACRNNEGFYITSSGYSEMTEKISKLTEEKKEAIVKMNNLADECNKKEEKMSKLKSEFNDFKKTANSDINNLNIKCEKLMKIIKDNNKAFALFKQNCFNDAHNVLQFNSSSMRETENFSKLYEDTSAPSSYQHISNSAEIEINDMVNHFQDQVNDLYSSITKERADVCKFYEAQIGSMKRNFEMCATNFQDSFAKTRQMYQEKYDSLKNLNDQLRENKREKEEMDLSVIKQLNENNGKLKMQWNDVIQQNVIRDQENQLGIDRLKKCLAKCQSKINNLSLKMNENMEKTSEYLDELRHASSKMKEDINNCRQSSQLVSAKMCETKKKALVSNTSILNAINKQEESQENVKQNFQNFKKIITDSSCVGVLQEKSHEAQLAMKIHNTNLITMIDKFSDLNESLNNLCSRIAIDIDDYEKESRRKADHCGSYISNNIDYVDTTKTKILSHVGALKTSVNKFVCEEWKSYSPKGDTPQRQTYNYQQPLNGTSLETLRSRFKENNMSESS